METTLRGRTLQPSQVYLLMLTTSLVKAKSTPQSSHFESEISGEKIVMSFLMVIQFVS